MKSLLLKNGLITDPSSGTISAADLLLLDGRIKTISKKIEARDCCAEVLELQESYIYPGFIDCHTHMGIMEECTGKLGIGNNESSNPVTPELRAIDGINPRDISFQEAVRSGITCVMSGPGSTNPVGGLNMALKTTGTIIDRMAVKNPLGLKISLGENPISFYGKQDKCPVTRMGIASLIRDLFMRAEDYMNERANGNVRERDIKMEAVVPLLKGEIALRAHAHRADDILTAVRIAEEFGIQRLVIEHGTEAHLVMDYLKERNIPVAFGPMLTPRIKMELQNRHYNSVVKLIDGGIRLALITDHPYNSIDQLRTIAIIAASEGLSPTQSLKCITESPAAIMGLDDRMGRLAEGYDADLVVLSKPALDITSKVQFTIINGEIAFQSNKSNGSQLTY